MSKNLSTVANHEAGRRIVIDAIHKVAREVVDKLKEQDFRPRPSEMRSVIDRANVEDEFLQTVFEEFGFAMEDD